jgi:hypothetical protein
MWGHPAETPVTLAEQILKTLLQDCVSARRVHGRSDRWPGLERDRTTLIKHRVLRRYSAQACWMRRSGAPGLRLRAVRPLQERPPAARHRGRRRSTDIRQATIAALIPDMPWVGTGARPSWSSSPTAAACLRNLRTARATVSPTITSTLLFNAATDAALALATGRSPRPKRSGLATCPDQRHPRPRRPDRTNWLALPERVIPLAGLCLGWPSDQATDVAAAAARP